MSTTRPTDKQKEWNRAITNEKVLPEEKKLATRLRQLCTYYGYEHQAHLTESAVVIMELGEYYIKKATYVPTEENSKMLQKLSFIKCCALLNGARVRFELLKDKKNLTKVNMLLEKFSKSLLDVCGVGQCDESLPKISKHLYKRLKTMRLESEVKLTSIPKVDQESQGGEFHTTEVYIVEQVKALYRETTQNFTDLMKAISDKCVKILGPPPCKFCQAGLGSLARCEITMYSDYEHVIILENGVENLPNYTEIQEYFRWFAVVFQTMIIGLGETFIRSVGVKSINDLYSGVTMDNWYFDNITPCGISFDGMVPHSCMNPLGRQIATKRHDHKVELIQPARIMAAYLSTDENRNNGYYIKDILTRTCLVYGDQQVYDSFLSASSEVLMSEDMWIAVEEQSEKIAKNVNEYIRGARMQLHSDAFNPKVTFYRPITAMLAYFARINEIKASSSFEIVGKLQALGVIDESLSHRISYAVALASKIRMEAYVKTGHQRADTDKVVLEAVGARDSWSCYKTIQYLKIALLIIKNTTDTSLDTSEVLKSFNEDFFAPNVTEDVFQLIEMGKFEDAVKLGEEHLELITDELNYLKLRWLLSECYLRLARKNIENRSEYWTKAEAVCMTLANATECPPDARSDAYVVLSEALEFGKKYEEGIMACSCWFALYRRHEEVSSQHSVTYLIMLRRDMEMRIKYMDPNEMVNFIMIVNVLEERIDARIISWYWTARVLSNLNHLYMVRIILLNLVEEFRKHIRQYEYLLDLLGDIYGMQNKNCWFEDALVTMYLTFDAYRHFDVDKKSQTELDRHILETLCRMERWGEGMLHIEIMSAVSRETNVDLVNLILTKKSVGNAGKHMLEINEDVTGKITSQIPHVSEVESHLNDKEKDITEFLQRVAESNSISNLLHEMIEKLPDDITNLVDVHDYGILTKVLIVITDYGYMILKNHLPSLAKLARHRVLDHGEYASTLWKIIHSKGEPNTKKKAIQLLVDYISVNLPFTGDATQAREDSKLRADDRSFFSDAMLNHSVADLLPQMHNRIVLCMKHLSDPYQIETYAEILFFILMRLINLCFNEAFTCLVQAPKEVMNHKLVETTVLFCFINFCEATFNVLWEKYNEEKVTKFVQFFDFMLENPNDDLQLRLIEISSELLEVSSCYKSDFDPSGSCLDLLSKLDSKSMIDRKEYVQLLWKIINGKSSTRRKRKAINYTLHVISTKLFSV